jgi:hypothetical protein
MMGLKICTKFELTLFEVVANGTPHMTFPHFKGREQKAAIL